MKLKLMALVSGVLLLSSAFAVCDTTPVTTQGCCPSEQDGACDNCQCDTDCSGTDNCKCKKSEAQS